MLTVRTKMGIDHSIQGIVSMQTSYFPVEKVYSGTICLYNSELPLGFSSLVFLDQSELGESGSSRKCCISKSYENELTKGFCSPLVSFMQTKMLLVLCLLFYMGKMCKRFLTNKAFLKIVIVTVLINYSFY